MSRPGTRTAAGPSAGGRDEFRLRSIAIAAFGPATLFGLAEGAMLPVIALSSIDRGASTAVAALINALLGIGSIVTNIPSGMLATRIGERKAMLVAAAVAVAGLILCLVNLGRGPLSLVVFGLGVLLLGAASSVYPPSPAWWPASSSAA